MTPRRAAVALLLAVVTAVGVQRTSEPPRGDTEVLGASKERPPLIDAACDVDGVTVDYEVGFRSEPGTPEYRVVRAVVGDVAATCIDATVSVELRAAGIPIASGSERANATTVEVGLADAPSARAVDQVWVQIAGGTVPKPPPCAAMAFDRFLSLTTGPDVHTGSKDRDLVYGLEGADVLRGDNQHDCLDGQGGDDQLFGDNHDDVLIGGAGDDVLTGGNGDDRLYGGAGFDRCIGGTGKNTLDPTCEVRL